MSILKIDHCFGANGHHYQGSTLTVVRLPGATQFHVGQVKIYLAVALSGNRHTLPHHLVNAGKSDKLTNIHYNDKLDESPDLFTTSFASGGDP